VTHTGFLHHTCSSYTITRTQATSATSSSDRAVKLARTAPFAFTSEDDFDQRLHTHVKKLIEQQHTEALLAALVKGSGPLLVKAAPGAAAGAAGAASGAAASPGGSGSSTTSAGLSTQQQREALQQQLRRELIQLAYSEIFGVLGLPQRYGAALDLAMQGPGKALDVWVLLQLLACRLGVRVVVLVQQPQKGSSGRTEVVAVQVLPVARGERRVLCWLAGGLLCGVLGTGLGVALHALHCAAVALMYRASAGIRMASSAPSATSPSAPACGHGTLWAVRLLAHLHAKPHCAVLQMPATLPATRRTSSGCCSSAATATAAAALAAAARQPSSLRWWMW
jgi:hypothetical protein